MLIGSKAARFHFPDYPREPKDTDYISDTKIDASDTKWCPSFKFLMEKYPMEVPPANVLYTLKVSHSFWNIHWEKTIFDIQFFQSKSLKIDEELFHILYKDCELRYGSKQAYLNTSNDNFFKDGVTRKYVHDSIHEAMAFYERPLYESIKTDSAKALTSNQLFLNLSYEDKINLCLEEIYVTALERFLIPSDFSFNRYTAYSKACKLLITSMTKGWFAKFLVENYLDISKRKSYDYTLRFKNNLHKLKNI